jgi:hypothetical protein
MIARAYSILVLLSIATPIWTLADGGAGTSTGPLRVHPDNPRYFADGAGNILYLTGAHTWMEFQTQKGERFDFADWLEKFRGWDHNFMRGWHWEDGWYSPLPYKKVNGKYDLTAYNEAYFKRLRERIEMAGRLDPPVYVSVMLFQGWSAVDKKRYRSPKAWPKHPYNPANNINGIDGKQEKSHELHDSRVTSLQEAYVKHTIDALIDLDNIIWEISNESHPESWQWQRHMVRVIKDYEAAKPKQHMVWVNVAAPSYEDLLECPADVVSPGGDIFRNDPPVSTGRKIVVADSDHQGPLSVTHVWAWKNFTRGNLPILMDCKYQPKISWWGGRGFRPDHPKWDHMRRALGATRRLAAKIDLVAMAPQAGFDAPASTGYCLFSCANPKTERPRPDGAEFVVYAPDKNAPLTVKGLKPGAEYAFDWIHPVTGLAIGSGRFKADAARRDFSPPPVDGDIVLHLRR